MYICTYGLPEYDDYVKHHGVKGMHWGIRRYQNYDGTLIKTGSAIRKKTKYTNIDGSLNEKGKLHSQDYINKEIKKNNKYYDKYVKKYNKLMKKYEDNPELKKKFKDMIDDAERTRASVNKNIQQMGIDEIMSNETEARNKAIKTAGTIASAAALATLGAGGIAAASGLAASAAAGGSKLGKTLMDFDPSTIGDKVIEFANNDPRGQKAYEYLDGGIRAYADARSYVIGTFADQAMKRLDQMGVIDEIGNTAGKISATTTANAYNNIDPRLASLISSVGNSLGSGMASGTAQAANNVSPVLNQTSGILSQIQALQNNPITSDILVNPQTAASMESMYTSSPAVVNGILGSLTNAANTSSAQVANNAAYAYGNATKKPKLAASSATYRRP